MEADALANRRRELTAYAEQQGIQWERELEGLPLHDDGLVVAAVASLLDLDIQRVFAEEVNLRDLERESLRLQVESEVRQELGGTRRFLAYGAFSSEELTDAS
jgi:hypothetical protein